MFWVKMYQNSVKMIKKRNFCFALSVLCFALLGHRLLLTKIYGVLGIKNSDSYRQSKMSLEHVFGCLLHT